MFDMSVSELVSSLPLNRRTLLCELLIEIILDSKNKLSNEVILSILAMWTNKQAITINKTMGLIKTAQETNPEATLVLLTKMGLITASEMVELESLNG